MVYRKELTDSLRDRRTIVSMIVIPTILMPLLALGVGGISAALFGEAMHETPVVMVLGAEASPQVRAALEADRGLKVVPPEPVLAELISDKKIRSAVEIPADFDAALARGQAAPVRIYVYGGDLRSGFAADRLQKFFRDFRDRIVRARLEARGLSTALIEPIHIEQQNVAPPERVSGAVLGGLIPYFVILFCLTGAMYPAIDLTAGEKERGTMETILCSPVSRTQLVLGKFLLVLTASLAAAMLSLVSLGLTMTGSKQLFSLLTPAGNAATPMAIHAQALVWVFLLVLPLAMFFSAALLAIALFAKSYKEAQSYISPLAIVVLLPAIISVMPGVELNAGLSLVPVLNTSLASTEIVSGIYHWKYLALILISSCAYAAAALAIAVRLFEREEVLFRT